MKKLILIMVVLVAGCNQIDVQKEVAKKYYSFSVQAADHGAFNATIEYGADKLDQFDRLVNQWGYGSGVDLAPGQEFQIFIETDRLMILEIDGKAYSIEPNTIKSISL